MNKRAKLSLASSRDIPKKQAPGFEGVGAAPESARVQAGPTAQLPPRQAAVETAAKNRASAANSAKAKAVPAPRPRQLLKVVVVLVATALSLYLLKRRFF